MRQVRRLVVAPHGMGDRDRRGAITDDSPRARPQIIPTFVSSIRQTWPVRQCQDAREGWDAGARRRTRVGEVRISARVLAHEDKWTRSTI